ncbi:protein of unknown function [endosymbiont DhMRE of Dentiscutata heterogama]|uniref:hypothetical protein n=1 Tax=endosymbiont DhMRE of Dentiscutata heterogama TaxID=1609546 RepID=UPI000629D619|nr:hypothetical protein [endosymbiont DhMRE of Dentiscutata heterogama]CFW92948.1 protein of unknown function [endosymbiont DhMRE of Dentiscutata heterogama]
MKGIKLGEIKRQYKFTIDQAEQINDAKNWMLTKYGECKVKTKIEIIKGKLQTIIILFTKNKEREFK